MSTPVFPRLRKLVALIFMLVAGAAHAQPSAENTRIPPAPSINIIVTRTDVWALGGPNPASPGNFWVTRNGIGVLGASASKMALCQGSIYVLGRDKFYWKYTGSAWQATKLPTIPCDPVNIIAVFNLEWTPGPIDGNTPAAFRVYRDGAVVATVKYPTTSYTDTIPDVPAGKRVAYYVTAVNAGGESPKSNEVSGTAAAP